MLHLSWHRRHLRRGHCPHWRKLCHGWWIRWLHLKHVVLQLGRGWLPVMRIVSACWSGSRLLLGPREPKITGCLLIKINKKKSGNIPGYWRFPGTGDWLNKRYHCTVAIENFTSLYYRNCPRMPARHPLVSDLRQSALFKTQEKLCTYWLARLAHFRGYSTRLLGQLENMSLQKSPPPTCFWILRSPLTKTRKRVVTYWLSGYLVCSTRLQCWILGI